MGQTQRAAILIALTTLLPAALAAPAEGAFTIQAAQFPSGAEPTLEPEAAIIRDTERIETFSLNAPLLRVTLYSMEFLGATAIPASPAIQTATTPRTFTLTNAVVAKAASGDHAGHVGFYPAPAATLRIAAQSETSAESAVASAIKADGEGTEDSARLWWYSQPVEGPHIHYAASGACTYTGGGTFKIYGLDLTLQGSENATPETFRTGRFQEDALHYRQVWLILEADDAHLTTSGETQIEAASRTPAEVEWNGAASLTAASGAIHSADASYFANGGLASLEGAFTATLTPIDGRRVTMDAKGDLRSTSMLSVAIPSQVRPSPSLLPWSLGLLVVGIAVGSFAVGSMRRRGFDRDYCLDMADRAQSIDNHKEALKWIARARKLNPRDARLLADEAYSLALTGKTNAALLRFREAHDLSQTGEIALAAAFLMHKLDYPSETVLGWLERALERSPILLDDLTSRDFDSLQSDPRWKAIIQRARMSPVYSVRP